MIKTPLIIKADNVFYDETTDKINVVFAPENIVLQNVITHSHELSVANTTPEAAISVYLETARQEILKNLPAKFANMFE